MSLAPLNRGKENTTKRGSSLPSLIVELPALLFLALAFGFGEAFAPPPANNDCRGSASMAGGICMSSGRASKRVVVVGAGAAGLATAKEMRVRGHEVVVLEQASEIGGVWSYEPEVEDDPMSVSSKKHVHSSMYKSLRTNLPREVMSFSDFPFGSSFSELRYPSHSAVQDYLLAYADHFSLRPLIALGRKVVSIEPLNVGGWKVTHCDSTAGESSGCTLENFNAVAVCNGHYSAAHVPPIPGIEHFRGTFSHSHNYREPERFAGKRVAVVGASNSGEDIANEVSTVAESVVMCASGYLRGEWGRPGSEPTGPRGNIYRWPRIERVTKEGGLQLEEGGGIVEGVDHIVFCTGYRYTFPFLEPEREVLVDDNMVTPLYMHMFPASRPDMAFIGLPAKIVPFPQFELQARWASMVWSGEAPLPPSADMHKAVRKEVDAKQRAGLPKKHFHVQGGGQFAYNDELARLTGGEALPAWRRMMYEASGRSKRDRPWDYRDAPLETQEAFEAMAAGSAAQDNHAHDHVHTTFFG